MLYWAVRGHGAFKEANGEVHPISAMHHEHDQPDSLVVAISRRQKLENLTRRLNPAINYELIPLGSSSLKSCLVAEGAATATCGSAPPASGTPPPPSASSRVGGRILSLALQPLRYNETESLENPDFIVMGIRISPGAAFWRTERVNRSSLTTIRRLHGRLIAWCDPLVLSGMNRNIRWQSAGMTVNHHKRGRRNGTIFQVILQTIIWPK